MVGKIVAGLITDLLTGMGFNAVLNWIGIGRAPKEGERKKETGRIAKKSVKQGRDFPL
jgi:hypothetical protein